VATLRIVALMVWVVGAFLAFLVAQTFWAFWAWIVVYPIALAIIGDLSRRRRARSE